MGIEPREPQPTMIAIAPERVILNTPDRPRRVILKERSD
jgi:hypothetical protein